MLKVQFVAFCRPIAKSRCCCVAEGLLSLLNNEARLINRKNPYWKTYLLTKKGVQESDIFSMLVKKVYFTFKSVAL